MHLFWLFFFTLGLSGRSFYCEQDLSADSAGVDLQVGPVLR